MLVVNIEEGTDHFAHVLSPHPPDRAVRTGTAVVTKPYNIDKRTESWRVKQHCQHVMASLRFKQSNLLPAHS